MPHKEITLAVFGHNAGGEPDVCMVTITATDAEIERGDHYEKAKDEAANQGYDPCMAADPGDPAFSMLSEPKERNALTDLLLGLRDLGFGSDDEIDGGDAVEAIADLYADVTARILGEDLTEKLIGKPVEEAAPEKHVVASTVHIVPAFSDQAGQCRIYARPGNHPDPARHYLHEQDQWHEIGIMDSKGNLRCIEPKYQELSHEVPLRGGATYYFDEDGKVI